MARLRTIKPGFFKDPELGDLPVIARYFYAGLWCQADREGRLQDEPRLLKLEICPYDDVDPENLLVLLATPRSAERPGFIVRYQVGGRRYIWIPHFLDHQKPYKDETKSRIPPPPCMTQCTPKDPQGDTALSLVFGLPSSVLGLPSSVSEQHAPSPAEQAPAPAAASGNDFVAFVRAEWPDIRQPDDFEKRAQAAFPGINLAAEAVKARGWELSDRTRKKRNHGKFLWGWLARAQDNASHGGVSAPRRAGAAVLQVDNAAHQTATPGRKFL
jgi:hypothetical protein